MTIVIKTINVTTIRIGFKKKAQSAKLKRLIQSSLVKKKKKFICCLALSLEETPRIPEKMKDE